MEYKVNITLHRPKRKMRENAVMIYISYNYVSSNLLNVLLLFSTQERPLCFQISFFTSSIKNNEDEKVRPS